MRLTSDGSADEPSGTCARPGEIMSDRAAELFAGHMGVCAVLVNVLIDKRIVSRSEFCDRFQQAKTAASQCSGGPMVADALEAMVEYLAQSATRPSSGRQALEGETILLVEEQSAVSRPIQKSLEASGAEVLVARDAGEALTRIGQFEVSAAVLSWLPDNLQCRALARRLQQRGVRFILCAAELPAENAAWKGVPILRKPVRPREVVKAVTLLIGAGGEI